MTLETEGNIDWSGAEQVTRTIRVKCPKKDNVVVRYHVSFPHYITSQDKRIKGPL